MNSTTFNTHTNANYAGNVANAARQLFAALFAEKTAAVAKDMEAHSPHLAAELRIAARFG
jgi:hypothetical protein